MVSLPFSADLVPQATARELRALRKHAKLFPHDVRMHARGRQTLCETAVHAGNDVFPPDELRVAHQTLGHEFGVLDAVRRVRDDARNDDLALRELDVLPDMILVLVARVRRLD